MWKQEKNDSVIVHLALSLALATTSLAANFLASVPVLAESTPNVLTFPLPQTVESGTKVRLDGSMSLIMINQSLKDNFEKQFSGTQVEIGVNGTDAAITALLDGKIDIAAIARQLTPAEKSQGLEQIRLHREKIAIIVGINNSFPGNLTSKKFAQIFRGEITDWSELGGQPGKIRFIDRSPTSDIRNSLRDYPVFQSGEFSTGANATQVAEDKTVQIIKELGTDGISYVTANQVSKLPDVRILKIQNITPDNSQYPFSQPLVYVYRQNPSPAVASFLGFTTAPIGQKAIESARDAEASAIAASALQNLTVETATSSTPKAQSVATPAQTETLPTTNNSGNQQLVNPFEERNTALLIVLSLFPTVGIGSFFTWWLKKKQQSANQQIAPLKTSTLSPSITELKPADPDEYNIISPVNNTALTNGKSQSHHNINVTEREVLADNAKIVTAKDTTADTEIANNLDIAAQIIYLDCGEVVWDIEAPVAVVNTSYPSVPNVPEITFNNLELPIDELTTSLLELLDESVESSTQNSTISLSELLDESVESSTQNSAISLSELLGVPANLTEPESNTSLSELLDVLTNATESESSTSVLKSTHFYTETSHEESSTSLSELLGLTPDEEELDAELITDEAKNSLPDLLNQLEEVFNTLADEAELKFDLAEELSSDLSISSHLPETTIKETTLEIDAKTEKIFSPDGIPEHSSLETKTQTQTTGVVSWSDMRGDSSIVFTPRTPKWAYVSWYVSEIQKEAVRKQKGTFLAVRLYDTTDIDLSYQIPHLVQQYECEEAVCDSYVAIPTSNRDYMTEIGYLTDNNSWLCIARSGKVRIFNRPGTDFWFIADTELVIHGSTEPGANVTVAGHRIKVQSDGTFHLRVPFSDRLLNYLMTATTADGEHSITILKKFFQETSEN
ncbi:substrate-binding domain-containing protein [Anabaena sp. UHCC 0451]|uniref:substrate-binding domain-containing protein n=1 Tax=Anabaena sp. UHCC 0451 TaxID=2055235 RepID=UPI002B21D502|nr:substrate-binding domain-containing protein [Anabaena sp. UHCC 0451]MEA5577288.1 substrate-binding domain-containing protein [Anabaena sp. UHCC 0451]